MMMMGGHSCPARRATSIYRLRCSLTIIRCREGSILKLYSDLLVSRLIILFQLNSYPSSTLGQLVYLSRRTIKVVSTPARAPSPTESMDSRFDVDIVPSTSGTLLDAMWGLSKLSTDAAFIKRDYVDIGRPRRANFTDGIIMSPYIVRPCLVSNTRKRVLFFIFLAIKNTRRPPTTSATHRCAALRRDRSRSHDRPNTGRRVQPHRQRLAIILLGQRCRGRRGWTAGPCESMATT